MLMPIKAGTERSLFSSLISKTTNSRELISLSGVGTWHRSFYSIFTENRQVTLYICYDDLLKSTVRLYKQEPLQVEERGKVMQTAGWQQRRCPGHGSHAASPQPSGLPLAPCYGHFSSSPLNGRASELVSFVLTVCEKSSF